MDKIIESRNLIIEYIDKSRDFFENISFPVVKDDCYKFSIYETEKKEYIIPLSRIHRIDLTTSFEDKSLEEKDII